MKISVALLAVLCLVISWYCVISSAGMYAPDFFPLWNAGRALLHGVNGYGDEVTRENQIAVFGAELKSSDTKNKERFAYPLYATFPILPLVFLDFKAANLIALLVFAALTALSVGWLRGAWDWLTLLYSILTFSSYPVVVSLFTRQPTLLFFGLMVGSFALARSERLAPAGIVAALAMGKPQVALPLLLPICIWTIIQWRERRRFIISFSLSIAMLVLLSSLASPGWMTDWLTAVRLYSQYNSPSVLTSLFGARLGAAIAALLCGGLVWVLWLHRHSELLFQMAACCVVVEMIIPYQTYNAVLLLVPLLWLADNGSVVKQRGAIPQFALAAMWLVLFEGWLATAAGAMLWHGPRDMRRIGVMLPPWSTRVLLWSVVIVMAVALIPTHKAAAGKATEVQV